MCLFLRVIAYARICLFIAFVVVIKVVCVLLCVSVCVTVCMLLSPSSPLGRPSPSTSLSLLHNLPFPSYRCILRGRDCLYVWSDAAALELSNGSNGWFRFILDGKLATMYSSGSPEGKLRWNGPEGKLRLNGPEGMFIRLKRMGAFALR